MEKCHLLQEHCEEAIYTYSVLKYVYGAIVLVLIITLHLHCTAKQTYHSGFT